MLSNPSNSPLASADPVQMPKMAPVIVSFDKATAVAERAYSVRHAKVTYTKYTAAPLQPDSYFVLEPAVEMVSVGSIAKMLLQTNVLPEPFDTLVYLNGAVILKQTADGDTLASVDSRAFVELLEKCKTTRATAPCKPDPKPRQSGRGSRTRSLVSQRLKNRSMQTYARHMDLAPPYATNHLPATKAVSDNNKRDNTIEKNGIEQNGRENDSAGEENESAIEEEEADSVCNEEEEADSVCIEEEEADSVCIEEDDGSPFNEEDAESTFNEEEDAESVCDEEESIGDQEDDVQMDELVDDETYK